MAFCFSEERKKFYPPELWPKIRIAPTVIDTAFFNPVKASPFSCPKFGDDGNGLVTIFARNLAEEDLFRCWTACLEILKRRKETRLVLLVNGVYTMRRLRQIELPRELADRLYIEAHLRQDNLRDLLASSILTVFPGALNSLGLIESMGCASCPMTEKHEYFLKDGWDSLSLGRLEHMPGRINEALEETEALKLLGAKARETAQAEFSSATVMPRFFPKIEQAYQEWNGKA